jgi:hypothetical protein
MIPTRACVSAKGGPLRGDEEVAAQRHLEPAGGRHAVDGADHGLRDQRERSALLRWAVVPAERLRRGLGPGAQLLEVEAGAEGRVGARQDDDVDPVVGLEVVHGRVQRPAQGPVEGVAGLGPVQRHRGDTVRDVEGEDVGVGGDGHGLLLCQAASASQAGLTSRVAVSGRTSAVSAR